MTEPFILAKTAQQKVFCINIEVVINSHSTINPYLHPPHVGFCPANDSTRIKSRPLAMFSRTHTE